MIPCAKCGSLKITVESKDIPKSIIRAEKNRSCAKSCYEITCAGCGDVISTLDGAQILSNWHYLNHNTDENYRRAYIALCKFITQSRTSKAIQNELALDLTVALLAVKKTRCRLIHCEHLFLETPERAYGYIEALQHTSVPRKEFERVIAQSAEFSYKYANMILGERFNLGEATIAKDPEYAYKYWVHVWRRWSGRWIRGEKAIAQIPENAVEYAWANGMSRFKAAEPFIIKDPNTASGYACNILEKPWPEAESVIAKDGVASYRYAHQILSGQFKAGEKAIKKNPEIEKLYRELVIRASNKKAASKRAARCRKCRW